MREFFPEKFFAFQFPQFLEGITDLLQSFESFSVGGKPFQFNINQTQLVLKDIEFLSAFVYLAFSGANSSSNMEVFTASPLAFCTLLNNGE